MDLSSTINFLSDNYEKVISRGGIIIHPVTNEMFTVRFDANSYDQVLVISQFIDYNEVVQFCCTEFGIYLKDAKTNEIGHYLYQTLMVTLDFGLTFENLVQCHYMFKNFPASGN